MRSRSSVGHSVVGFALAALAGSCTIQQGPAYMPATSAALEVNVDRPGADYRSFDLASGRPEECRDTCMVEPQCVAFTFVNPGVQGPSARCWLKSAAPDPTSNNCCISGVKNSPAPTADYGAQQPPVEPQPPAPGYVPEARPGTPPSGGQWVGTPPAPHHGLEMGVDRPGSDYSNFDLPQPRPHLCKEACTRDRRCRAFTYVNPGVQGPNARCWLKDTVPPPVSNQCCVSGAKGEGHGAPPPQGGAFEMNVDRPGYDFQNFDLPQPNPELCRAACMREGQCRAFTYVNPGVQGPSARCWLKMDVPQSTPNNCCISGVK